MNELRLWCQPCWEKYGPLADERVSGLVLTVVLAQEFMQSISDKYPDAVDPVSIAYVEGPACCFMGAEKMKVMSRAMSIDMLKLAHGPFDGENGYNNLMAHLANVERLMGES